MFVVKENTTGLYFAGTGKYPTLQAVPNVYSSVRSARGAISNILGGRHNRISYKDPSSGEYGLLSNPDMIIQEIAFTVVSEYGIS